MKKNKGFTLAELLVIIVIIGLLIGLTGYTVTRVVKQSRENIKAQNLKSLIDSANTYMNQVVEGKDEYHFENGNYSGYKFLVNVAENCGMYSSCKYTNKDDVGGKYTAELYVSLTSLNGYIDTSKYVDGKCNMNAYVSISKNDKGYYILDGLEVKAANKTKAKTCVNID